MMRSYTNISLNSVDDPIFQASSAFFKDMSKKLQQASQWLSFMEFNQIFKQVVIKCIKKAEVDINFAQAIPNIKKWISLYSYDLQILVRLLILQSVILSKQQSQQALDKLVKVKHLLVDTNYEYLLAKVFVVESRIYQIMGQRQMKLKILKKCIQFSENNTVEYLKQSNQARIQIADNMIIAYFQMFKLTKESKPVGAVQYLSKAYQAAYKNYGSQHFSTQNLAQILQQQKNLMSNMEKLTPKALSQIQIVGLKKNMQLSILYSWEEQLLVIQLYKIKGDSQRLISQNTVGVKLDMEKIKIMKGKHYGEWLEIQGADIRIIDENFKRMLGGETQKVQSPHLRQVDRGDIFKRNQSPVSSSSDEEDNVVLPEEKFLRFLHRDRTHLSGIKSRDKSRDRSRDNHTSRH